MQNRWSEPDADRIEKSASDEKGGDLALRVYSSRLLGGESALVLHGGGNTSVKSTATNVLGEEVEVIFIKGSGWNLSTIEAAGFPAVDLPWLRRLRALEVLSDEDMVNAIRTHMLDASAPNPSIETLVHAFLPHKFIDHSHADAIVALTNLADGVEQVRRALGGDVAMVPYVKPGFDLSKVVAEVYEAHPDCIGLVLRHHGLFSFGDTARESYERHIEIVNRAEAHLARIAAPPTPMRPSGALDVARERAGHLAPLLRGALAEKKGEGWERWILAHRCDEAVLQFVDDARLASWAASGPLTPDHVIRTKRLPVVVRVDLAAPSGWRAAIDAAIHDYRDAYNAEFEACASAAGGLESYTRLDSTPRVVLVPGVGLFGVGADLRAANVAADIYEHTVAVKTAAAPLGPYLGLSPELLFEMEYWSLEQAKLGRGTPPPLARRVALVTGAAGAIGLGVARQLLAAGAHVVLTDVDEVALAGAAEVIGGGDRVATVLLDVTRSASVEAAFLAAARAFGGVDFVVANAGIAVAGPLDAMSEADFTRVVEVNLTGTFRTVATAARHLKAQQTGGGIVIVSTKNVLAPGAEFGAYSASKAGGHQLGKIAALELGAHGIRVNLVTPDAVFSEGPVSSGLWRDVGPERAAARGLSLDELPAFYHGRNVLHAEITGAHVGNAVVFFASELTPTTGATLPVDGGVVGAFPR